MSKKSLEYEPKKFYLEERESGEKSQPSCGHLVLAHVEFVRLAGGLGSRRLAEEGLEEGLLVGEGHGVKFGHRLDSHQQQVWSLTQFYTVTRGHGKLRLSR